MTDLCVEINRFGKGIGHATRFRIIERLLKGRKTVGELVKQLRLSQPLVSQHLRILKESNLVTDERDGQAVYYAVNAAHTLKLLHSLIKDLQKKHS